MNTIASVKGLLRGFNSLDWSRLGFKSVSFFEEVGSPGAPEDFGPIVNCEDVHIEGQKQIGLHADHWSTWNFSDPVSSTYKAVSTVIQSFYHGLQVIKSGTPFEQMDPDISGLLRSLHVNSTELLSIAMKGTCSWIFDHQAFGSWLKQPTGLLWIKGKPGSGKSTLLGYIYQTATFREPTSFLFFQFNYYGRTSINAMLRSLIFQLLIARPSYQLYGMRDTYAIRTETHGDYGTNWQWGDPELVSYLQESLLQATQDNSHVVIILDALDEATEELSVNSVILDILAIPSIRICASSRSSPRISNIDIQSIILEDLNTADITYYTKSRVSSVKCKDSRVQGDLIQSLIEASNGMFLYVDLALSNLEIWLDQPGAQREDRLGYIDFPKDLKDLYSSIISRIESSERNRDIVRHIFQWVAFATRPLTVPELMNAMAFEKVADYDLCFHDSHQALDAMSHLNSDICECAKRITSPCRGFIAIQSPITASRQSVVSFTHQTVFDFLMACEPLVLQPGTMQCRGHEALAWSCCQIILSETRSRRKGYIESCSGTRPISSYALESWMPHLRKALELGSSCSKILSDLSQKDFLENSLALGEIVASSYKQWPRLAHKSAIDMSWKANRWKPSSPLLLTSAVGHVGSCQRYISMGESYNDRDSLYGISPLGWAAAYGHSEVVELLLDSGAEADYTPNDTSPLQLAVRCGNKRVTQLLLERRPAINYEPTVTAQSALSLAASLGRASMITLLVSCGANALTVDDLGWNSLHHAIIAGKRATLAQLLSTIPKASFEKLKDLPPRNLPGWVHRVLLAFGLGLCCCGSGGSSSSATNCGSNDSGKVRKRGRQGSKKRGRDSTEDIDRNDEQSMAPPPQKQSRHTFGLRFACPYNKRCPNRFGGACSNFGFPDMHRLKEHLFRRHFLGCDKRTRCGRCKLIFPESEIQDHLILEMACEPMRVALNYEDGFDTNQSDTLKSLKPKQFETPVHHWEKTFNTVFPDWTTDLPSPYHETTETECRINVAARLRSEEFRQEVWRNFNDMGREVFEQLANLLDPWPSASNRPGNQPPSLPDELPMRPAVIQENVQTALNPSVESCLSTVPQRGTAASETRAAAPTLSSSAQRYRPIPPHFFFPNQQISDTLSLSLFSGTGSLNSFGPGQESMYGDMDANNASMSSWDCSFANARMEQTSNDPFEFTVNAPAPANNHESSRYENQPNHDTDLVTAADNQPPSMEEAANTLWAPARNSD
ncbi:hypothetical protein BFJ63_vAg14653 [Fusarium oxysporum f. sp. narcissi]|uniref:Nephrocystin 3-like N-terminal domain-containing protein n=1 Tax=Fusarium oxysporum f. sp. narcissi TaxID=451672 RepID=A0A4Q2VEC3_FUSOX|nr:hypothetical protein BFJ63_vAg14653 [Fusarium oxysporum f. sp. narcissi]